MTDNQYLFNQVLIVLRRIKHAMDRHSSQLAQQHGITLPQLLILGELARLKEVSVGNLAEHVSLSQATVTEILERLEKRGFVQRRRSDLDKRRVITHVTETGRNFLANAPPLLHEDFVNELSRFEEWERTQLLSLLQRIAFMMEGRSFGVSS